MKTLISSEPAKEAGNYVTQKLSVRAQTPVLFLVSGGSALDVLSHIDTTQLTSNITCVVTDERFTNDEKGNNFEQLCATEFYAKAREQGVHFIETKPQQNERHEQFALRIAEALEHYHNEHTQSYTIGIFGIGEDGHTASIFPTTEQEFKKAYPPETLVAAVTKPEQEYPFRISVTPSFIEEKVNEVVLYAVGSKKCDNILSYMHTKNFGVHEIPALIPARHPESILFTDCEALI